MTAAGATMASEMAEQPDRIAALVARRPEITEELHGLFDGGLSGTVVVARGSSDHAATTGRYLLELATKRPVSSASPSLETLYEARVDYTGYLVVGVSQSGRTPEISTVLEHAKSHGGRTVAVTNDLSSPLAETAEVVIGLEAGEERAVPATKTVTTELVAFALIAAALGLELEPSAFEALSSQAAAVLAETVPMAELAATLETADRLATVARGPLFGAAGETALKLEETSSLLAAAFSAADLRHGPIALAKTGLPVLAFTHPGPALDDVVSLADELSRRGADVHLLGPVPGSAAGWPAEAPEALAPVLAVVRGQQLALELALRRGLDPDSPHGLTKVTIT